MFLAAGRLGLRAGAPLVERLSLSAPRALSSYSTVASPGGQKESRRSDDLVRVRAIPPLKLVELEMKLQGQGKPSTVFLAPSSAFLSDFAADLRDETPKRVRTVRFVRPDGSEIDAEKATAADLVRADFVLKMDERNLSSDRTPVLESIASKQTTLAGLTSQFSDLTERKNGVERKALRRAALFRWSVGAGLVAQLSGVVYLTYDLGWDLMEPTTYLMGLAVSVASYGIYIYSKAEYEYGRHFNQVSDWIVARALKANKIDPKDVERLETSIRQVKDDLAWLASSQQSQKPAAAL